MRVRMHLSIQSAVSRVIKRSLQLIEHIYNSADYCMIIKHYDVPRSFHSKLSLA